MTTEQSGLGALATHKRRNWGRLVWAAIFLAFAVGVVASYYVAFWELPPDVVGRPKGVEEADRLALRNQVRTAAVQALGGIVLALGAVFTVRTLRLARQGQITDRFTSAVGHLGHEKPSVRVAAIHALGRVARDSRVEHPAIMAILGDHLRDWCPAPDPAQADDLTPAHSEVLAVALVLRERKVAFDLVPIDLSRIDLRLAPLNDMKLKGANLGGSNLELADLEGTDLERSNLYHARLGNANLQGAKLCDANLRDSTLDGANLEKADLRRADLAGASFEEAMVSGADFRGAVDANLKGARSQDDDPPRLP